MVKKIIKTFNGKVVRIGGSDYLLLDSTTKDLLTNGEGTFDGAKHEVIVQLLVNSKEQVFAAFWVQEKKEEG